MPTATSTAQPTSFVVLSKIKIQDSLSLFLKFMNHIATAAIVGLIAFAMTATVAPLPAATLVFGLVALSLILLASVEFSLRAMDLFQKVPSSSPLRESNSDYHHGYTFFGGAENSPEGSSDSLHLYEPRA